MTLFTTAEFKEAEGISGAGHDVYIGKLATRVTAFINSYCRRIFEAASYTEEIDGSGFNTILVVNPPVRALTSVKISAARDWAGVSAVDSSDVVFDDAGIVTLLPTVSISQAFRATPVFPKATRNIQIVYDGGFVTVPEDVTQGAIMLASAWFIRRRHGGILSFTSGGQNITYQQKRIPVEVAAIIDQYKLFPMFVGHDS